MRFATALVKRVRPSAPFASRPTTLDPVAQLAAAHGVRGHWLEQGRTGTTLSGRRPMSSNTVTFTILDPITAPEGAVVTAKLGDNVLDVAQAHDLELEGACEGTLACSTCHCIFPKELFDKLPPADEEELDMLDLAGGLTDT